MYSRQFASISPPSTTSQFGEALDQIGHRVRSELGPNDLAYIVRVDKVSHALEAAGRLLIMTSLEPVGFTLGVLALASHKCIQGGEIGHTVLHGAYDKLDTTGRYHSKTFKWDFPTDEATWRYGHNIRHHSYTNIIGRDPDVVLGNIRLTELVPHRLLNYTQLPTTLMGAMLHFGMAVQLRLSGILDLLMGNGLEEKFDFVADRSFKSIVKTVKQAIGKPARYYAKNYLFYPALAGPFFGKVLFGNWLAERIRDAYFGLIVLCGHAGDDVKAYPRGTRAKGRHQWYRMQIDATHNFEIPWLLSVFCGGLELQIEHHLFPDLPPHRLRQIAPEVRRLCREYGVKYRNASFRRRATTVLVQLAKLSRNRPAQAQTEPA